MAFITDDELKAVVAPGNVLGSPDSLPSHWDAIIPRANRWAYNRLRSILFNRGFTAAQFAAWDDGPDWNEQLGSCYAFWMAAKSDEDRGEPYRREYEQLLEDLSTLMLVIDGEPVNPEGAGTRISTGEYDDTSDIHTIDDTL